VLIEIYGKQDCRLCESAKKKVRHFLAKWNLDGEVPVVFQDMDNEHGAAEGDFYDVFEIPSVLLKEDPYQVLARWDGQAPPSEELRRRLCA
jgi:hypothetical protein